MISNLLFIQGDSVAEAINDVAQSAVETGATAAQAVTEQSFDLLSMAAKGGFHPSWLLWTKVQDNHLYNQQREQNDARAWPLPDARSHRTWCR